MKKRLIFIFMALSIVLNAQNTIKMATGEYEPYTSSEMSGGGFFTEIVTAACEEVNVKVEYDFYPWKRCEKLLETGGVFAIFPYVKTEEREKNFLFTDVVTHSTGKFFYLKSKFPSGIKYTDLKDLKKYTIGGTLGYWYEDLFKKNNLNVEYVSEDLLNIKKLEQGRIDLIVADELMGWRLIQSTFKNKQNEFATLEKPLNQSDFFMMVSKKYPNSNSILKKINDGLAIIKKNGVYKKILKKYGIK